MLGGLSIFHLIVITLVVLLLFGNRLPNVMRSMGQGIVEFKKGMGEIKDESDKGSSENSSHGAVAHEINEVSK